MDIKKAIKKVTSTEYATFQEMKLVPELEVVLTNLMIGLGKKTITKKDIAAEFIYEDTTSMAIKMIWG